MSIRDRSYVTEPLEPRRLLTILISGTGAADVITAERAGNIINVTINGTPSTRTVGTETVVQISGLGSGDTITVPDMAGLDLTVLCGTGDDTLTIGGTGGAGSSFEFVATVLSGDAGTDSVTFADSINYGNPVDSQQYELAGGVFRTTHTTFGGGTTASHDYDFETVTVTAGSEDSSFFVRALGAESTVQINAGGGGDTLVLNPLAPIATINFDGQGTSTLPPRLNEVRIEDTVGGGAAGDVYTLDDNSFDRTGFGLLNFSNVSAVSLTTHNLGTVVNLIAVLPGLGNTDTKASITGGTGADVINVGNGDYDANITGAVIVDGGGGGGGADLLAINDGADAGSDDYNLSNNLFVKSNAIFGVNFFGIEQISITGNGAGNVFDVSTENAAVVNLFGGGGSDTFRVTPRPVTELHLDGGSPTTSPGDTLIFESAETAGSASFAGGTYQFESAEDVILTSVETFPLPPAAPSIPDLRAEDDSGISFVDNITNENQPTFVGTALANLAVVLRDNSTLLGTGTAGAGGAWSIQSNALSDGTHPITAAARVPASGLTGPRSAPLSVTIDTVAPANPTVAPDLSTGSDTGLSFTDNVTRDNTPQLDGAVTANAIVRLFADGVQVGIDTTTPSGTYSIVSSTLTDGLRQMVVRFEDLAGNETSLSPALGVTIDTVAPATPAAAPDMTAATDTGVSSTDNITRNATPTFIGARPADVAVLMTQDNVIFGQVLTVGPTTYSITPAALADGSYDFAARFRDVAGNDSGPGPAAHVTIDTAAPTLASQAFNFLTSQNVRFAFSEDVGPTLAMEDFSLTRTPGGAVPAASIALNYAANTATFTFPGFTNGILPDGDYRAKIEGAGPVTDIAGNPFAGTELLFFFLNGDANRDRRVTLADFNILAANFGQSNRDFTQADFNYDGVVNLADFNILAGRFGQSLAAPSERGSSLEDLTEFS